MTQNIIFKNANVLLEGHDHLEEHCDVLIKDNVIEAVSKERLQCAEAVVIDAENLTLMPGLIDSHAHITGLSLSPRNMAFSSPEIVNAETVYLKQSLMAGFTTIREAGGADYSIAKLLKSGDIIGPRLFYSGKALTQTGGGADFRTPTESLDSCGHVGPLSVMSVIADGVTEVRKAAREELRKGASQIKIFSSGGVVFPSAAKPTIYEYSEEELKAIVEEAVARNTYVMAHVYTDEGVRRCLRAGVRSIEHGNFITEDTVKLMLEKGAFLNPTFISLVQRIESAAENHLSQEIVENLKNTVERGKQVYQWAKHYGVPIGLGTDLWGHEAQKEQLRELEIRATFDTPVNVIRSATVVNAELLMQKDKLGTIKAGALADLLLVKGNPLKDLSALLHPEENLKLIMKNGVIYKNVLSS